MKTEKEENDFLKEKFNKMIELRIEELDAKMETCKAAFSSFGPKNPLKLVALAEDVSKHSLETAKLTELKEAYEYADKQFAKDSRLLSAYWFLHGQFKIKKDEYLRMPVATNIAISQQALAAHVVHQWTMESNQEFIEWIRKTLKLLKEMTLKAGYTGPLEIPS